ncbi:MAG: hypothetical protein BGO77_07355 [Caedibacter sp. 37-49]|mgnify:CR=1 FL=1|nr:MAG: hypothetical protein BGO77_07355 [Caedibacter sp. 37-49]
MDKFEQKEMIKNSKWEHVCSKAATILQPGFLKGDWPQLFHRWWDLLFDCTGRQLLAIGEIFRPCETFDVGPRMTKVKNPLHLPGICPRDLRKPADVFRHQKVLSDKAYRNTENSYQNDIYISFFSKAPPPCKKSIFKIMVHINPLLILLESTKRMQKKTLFYIIFSMFILAFNQGKASSVIEEQQGNGPSKKKFKAVSIPLNLSGIKGEKATFQDNSAPISSPRLILVETPGSPLFKPGESPRDWDKPLSGTPRQEEQQKTTGNALGLRKKSSVARMVIQHEPESSPRAPKTPRQEDYDNPLKQAFEKGLECQKKGKLEKALKYFQEAFAYKPEVASKKIGEVAYGLGVGPMSEFQVTQDIQKCKIAFLYFKTADNYQYEAARKGLLKSAKALAVHALKSSDYEEAKELFIIGAERNDIKSLLNLGNLIKEKNLENSLAKHPWTAAKCYKRAALLRSHEGQIKYAQWAEQLVVEEKAKTQAPRLLYEAIVFYEMALGRGCLLDDPKMIQERREQKIYIEKLFNNGKTLFEKNNFVGAISRLEIAAKKGHLTAKLLMAQAYERIGKIAEAKKLYEELAELDDPEALCALARLNEEDFYETESLLKKAIYLNYPMAYFDLGILYARYARQLEAEKSGDNASKYYYKAICCYQDFLKNEDQNKPEHNAEAKFNLSLLFKWNGRIGETREYTKASALMGHPQAMHNYAVFLGGEGRKNRAKTWFEKAAIKGFSAAQVAMAEIETENGNIVEAAKWYQQAKFNNYPGIESILETFLQEQLAKHLSGLDGKDKDACFVLGVLYKVQENLKMAKKCLKISAQQDHIKAAFELGLLYEEEHNIQKALVWQEKGASGEGKALAHWAGLFYMNSLDAKDKEKALEALEGACEKGYLEGYLDLARRLEAAKREKKAEFFYQKDKELREKLANSHP